MSHYALIRHRPTGSTIGEFVCSGIANEVPPLALPAILFAPLGSIVLYGQFDQGIIVNEVSEEKKAAIVKLLRQFT